jgi:hypothetical protein
MLFFRAFKIATISVLVSSPFAGTIADDLHISKASDTIIESEINVTNPVILAMVKAVIQDTILMLEELDNGEKFGSISWANSFTISSAMDKLKAFLAKPTNGLTQGKIVKYNETMIEYFETYILADLNTSGLDMYKDLTTRQKNIIDDKNKASIDTSNEEEEDEEG